MHQKIQEVDQDVLDQLNSLELEEAVEFDKWDNPTNFDEMYDKCEDKWGKGNVQAFLSENEKYVIFLPKDSIKEEQTGSS